MADLKSIIKEHLEATGSKKAKAILDDFEGYLKKFKKIIPRDYKLITEAIADFERTGMDYEKAQIESFYKLVGQKA